MRDIDLFQLALGLVPPWMVADAKFDAEKKRLDIEIDFKTGGRFACPECGKADCPVHDTVKKTWRHLNFFQHEAFLHARVARIDCRKCGVRLVNVPWARPGSGFTLLFEALTPTSAITSRGTRPRPAPPLAEATAPHHGCPQRTMPFRSRR
jgi:transposase